MVAGVKDGALERARKRAWAAEQASACERRLAEAAAARHISRYFRDLTVPGQINIVDKKYINLCVERNICDAVDAAYRAMRKHGILQGSCGDGTIGEDVRFVVRLLKEIRHKCIPQEFSAGILLMHLEIMEGLSF